MTREVSLQRDKEEEMREDKCIRDKDLCHWAGGRSSGGGSRTSMKLPSVTDYQGSAFHYLPFITRYLWQQEVRDTRNPFSSEIQCLCVCEDERESKWCGKKVNCVGKWLL